MKRRAYGKLAAADETRVARKGMLVRVPVAVRLTPRPKPLKSVAEKGLVVFYGDVVGVTREPS